MKKIMMLAICFIVPQMLFTANANADVVVNKGIETLVAAHPCA